jgi:hypothetical protein
MGSTLFAIKSKVTRFFHRQVGYVLVDLIKIDAEILRV